MSSHTCTAAGRSVGRWPSRVGEPVGLGGGEQGGGAVDREAGGVFVDVPVAGLHAVRREVGVPAAEPLLGGGRQLVEDVGRCRA